jgi:thioesterase domain-containing protein
MSSGASRPRRDRRAARVSAPQKREARPRGAPGAGDARYPRECVVPPATELQRQLVALWETLLDVRPVGIRDDFFALGGHSLLALRLIAEIERQFLTRLPIAVLFERPTIEGLADALCCDPANLDRSPLVALNTEGTALPFYYHHGNLTGGGYYCLRLAELLGSQQPLFIFRPRGVDGDAIPSTIETIAAEYVTLLKSVRPNEPYLLGGYCGGGLVALEMARQLAAVGEHIDNVVLVDVPHPDPLALRARLMPIVLRIRRFAKNSNKLQALRRKLLMLRPLLDLRRTRRNVSARQTTVARPTMSQVWQSIIEKYIPHTYTSRVVLLVAKDDRRYQYKNMKAWPATSPRVVIRSISGTTTVAFPTTSTQLPKKFDLRLAPLIRPFKLFAILPRKMSHIFVNDQL